MGFLAKDDPIRPLWVPQIDGTGGFLPASFSQLALRRNPNTRVMVGATRDDGLSLCESIYSCIETLNGYTEINIDNMTTSISMAYGSTAPVVKNILDFVYKNGLTATAPADHKGWLDKYGDLMSGFQIYAGARKEMLAWQSIEVEVYMFSFDYFSAAMYPWRAIYPAAPHVSDLLFLFNQTDWSSANFTPSAADKSVADLMGVMWTNFAKSGNPNLPVVTGQPLWSPSRTANAEYYSISATPTMQADYQHVAHRMWNELIPELTSQTACPGCPVARCDSPCKNSTPRTSMEIYTILLLVYLCLLLAT